MLDNLISALLEIGASFTSLRMFLIVTGLLVTIAVLVAIVWELVRPA
jgi:hypothetical protein